MALERFCPKCGKRVEKGRVFCEECEPSKQKREPLETIELFACDCGRVARSRNAKRWEKHDTITRAIKSAIQRELEKNNLRVVDVDYEPVPLEKRMDIPVRVRAIDGKGKEQDLEARVVVYRSPCPDCSRRAGKYYEATIQVRGSEEDVERVSSEIEEMIKAWRERDPKSFVTSRETVRGGVDLKLGSKRAATRAAREIKKREDVETRETSELVGRRDGRNVTRKTILIRVSGDKTNNRGGCASGKRRRTGRKTRKK